jgi:hypothetical protein
MKILKILFFLFIFSLFSFNCKKNEKSDLQERLNFFKDNISNSAKLSFENKDYENCILTIQKDIEKDSILNEKFENIKKNEYIEIFTVRDVVYYFKEYFKESLEQN